MYIVKAEAVKSYRLLLTDSSGDDLDLGTFRIKDNWNGFVEVVNVSGETIILSDDEPIFDIAKLFGFDESKEMHIIRAAPAIIEKITKHLSPSKKP